MSLYDLDEMTGQLFSAKGTRTRIMCAKKKRADRKKVVLADHLLAGLA